jgi:hypothetical protein
MIISCKFGVIEEEAPTTGNEGSTAQAVQKKVYYDRRSCRDLKQQFLEQKPTCLREHTHAYSSCIKESEFLKQLQY